MNWLGVDVAKGRTGIACRKDRALVGGLVMRSLPPGAAKKSGHTVQVESNLGPVDWKGLGLAEGLRLTYPDRFHFWLALFETARIQCVVAEEGQGDSKTTIKCQAFERGVLAAACMAANVRYVEVTNSEWTAATGVTFPRQKELRKATSLKLARERYSHTQPALDLKRMVDDVSDAILVSDWGLCTRTVDV